jgi:hypothetical protein
MEVDILIVLLLWICAPFFIVTLIISPLVPIILLRRLWMKNKASKPFSHDKVPT